MVLSYIVTTGLGPTDIADGKNGCPVSVPRTTIQRWWMHFKMFGEAPEVTRKYAVRCRKKLVRRDHIELIKSLLDDDPTLFLDEIQDRIHRMTRMRYSIRSIGLVISRSTRMGGLGYTRKILEERAAQANEAEEHYYRMCLASVSQPEMLIFIDESHKSRGDARRRRGRGTKGKSVICRRLFSETDKENYTLIGAVNIYGFVKEACRVVWAKRGAQDPEPTLRI